jgi:MoxR-like ATPase
MSTPLYLGRGVRQGSDPQLPKIDKDRMRAQSGYLAGPGLAAAVDVALRLGMPLLLTGEPGIGKSQLARSLAWELNLGEPLRFVVKSDTVAQDLFYQFDTVGRLHAANSKVREPDLLEFIRFNALGKAILYTYESAALQAQLGAAFQALQHERRRDEVSDAPRRSVVLIDEIDKAPRDVPNDLLAEVEDMYFRIAEYVPPKDDPARTLEFRVPRHAGGLHPIVVITSNSEKSLPDAFLRRCIYYHMEFPKFTDDPLAEAPAGEGDDAELTVQDIVASRLHRRYQNGAHALVSDAIDLFRFLREHARERKPGLAELLNWLDYLLPKEGAHKAELARLKTLPLDQWPASCKRGIAVTLLKNKTDQSELEELLESWQRSD